MKQYTVYQIYDDAGVAVYVGCTKRDPNDRLAEALRPSGVVYKFYGRKMTGFSCRAIAVYTDPIEAAKHEQRIYDHQRPLCNGQTKSTPYKSLSTEPVSLDPALLRLRLEIERLQIPVARLEREAGMRPGALAGSLSGRSSIKISTARRVLEVIRTVNPEFVWIL